MSNRHKGSTLDSFLKEEDLFDETEAAAVKRIIVYQIECIMKTREVTKSKMATRMNTSRAGLDRLLDPDNSSVTLKTLVKAAHVLGGKLEISLSDQF